MSDGEKGITLVEVLVAILVLSILTVAFGRLFTTGVNGVFSAGERNATLYRAQLEMERILAVNPGSIEPSMIVDEQPLVIQFPGGTAVVEGKQVRIGLESRNSIVQLFSFVPDN